MNSFDFRRSSRRARVRDGGLVLAAMVLAALSPLRAADGPVEDIPTLPVSAADPLPEELRRTVPASVEELREIQKRVRSLNDRLLSVSVAIRRGPAQGTGVIIDEAGHVLTAAHVAGSPGSRVRVILADGTRLRGRSLGRETYIDAGLVKITESNVWPTAPLGSVRDLKPGDWVIGIGHPGGFQEDRSGVPRLGRVISKDDWVLRTDVALVGGDSGGPLFDLNGRVVGVHSRIGPDANLNFHVPINVYRDNWYWLLASEQRPVATHPGGPILGVNGEDAPDGCRVTRVFDNRPAKRDGLRVDDLIVRIDRRYIRSMDDLIASVNHYDAGEEIDMTIIRDGEKIVLPVRLGERTRDDSDDRND